MIGKLFRIFQKITRPLLAKNEKSKLFKILTWWRKTEFTIVISVRKYIRNIYRMLRSRFAVTQCYLITHTFNWISKELYCLIIFMNKHCLLSSWQMWFIKLIRIGLSALSARSLNLLKQVATLSNQTNKKEEKVFDA